MLIVRKKDPQRLILVQYVTPKAAPTTETTTLTHKAPAKTSFQLLVQLDPFCHVSDLAYSWLVPVELRV